MVSINFNFAAKASQDNLRAANSEVQLASTRLGTGEKYSTLQEIEAASFSIGTKLSNTSTRLNAILDGLGQAKAVLQTADGALREQIDILVRQQELAQQVLSTVAGNAERSFLEAEFQQLTEEIDRIATTTEFNGVKLLDGSLTGTSTITSVSAAGGAVANYDVDNADVGTAALDNTTITIATANDDLTLVGDLSTLTVDSSRTGTDNTYFININGKTYESTAIGDADGSAAITFTNAETAVTIALTLTGITGQTDPAFTADAAGAAAFADALQSDLRGATIFQSRTLDNTTGATLEATQFAGTIIDGLSGANFTLDSSSFSLVDNSTPAISDFVVRQEDSDTDGRISVSIGGETFSTGTGAFDNDATNLAANDAGDGAGIITLTNESDSNESLIIDFSALSSTSVGISTTEEAQALQDALNQVFSGGSGTALSFQVGLEVGENIAVNIADTRTTAIYQNSDNQVRNLSILTKAGAEEALSVLDNAVNILIAEQATTAAIFTRFEAAESSTVTTIQNVDSAASTLLDTDFAEASTDLATANVKLSSSVSVLSQANQIGQTLLQLIQ